MENTTLCVIYRDPDILLGMKKRGFGVGKWNGFGGKIGPGETVEDAAVRELEEECGLKAEVIEKVGLLEFVFGKSGGAQKVHIFRCEDFTGRPVETEEMRPRWFPVADLPYAGMWPDDRFWMPLLIGGKKFKGKFVFRENGEIKKHVLETVEKL